MGVCGLQLGRLVCSYDMDHDDHEMYEVGPDLASVQIRALLRQLPG